MARRSTAAFAIAALRGVLVSGIVFILLSLRSRASSSAPEADPCEDRPFKSWFAELMFLENSMIRVSKFFKNDWRHITPEYIAQYASREVLERVNPCALHLLDKYKDEPGMGDCTRFFIKMRRCGDGDEDCANYVVNKLYLTLKCYIIGYAHFLNGDSIGGSIEEDFFLSPFQHELFYKKSYELDTVEHSASKANKQKAFKMAQNIVKFFALGFDFRYPITLSGAICEVEDLTGKLLARQLENQGAPIAHKIRLFFEMSKDDQVECAVDELMWEFNECAAEIKKSYGKRTDPGDCTAHYVTATGKCRKHPDGEFDYNACLAALVEMRKGVECYVTRLARDAVSGFTTYASDDERGGTATFEKEHNACVAGGWLVELEADTELPGEVWAWIEKVYRSYKRLDTVGAFACEEW